MSRFVLLLHECPDDRPRATHCDLMLEDGAALRTWALSRLPHDWRLLSADANLIDATNTVDAEQLADHRLAYLDYEGPISGDRGAVHRLDQGTYQSGPLPNHFILNGRLICGEIELQPIVDTGGRIELVFHAAKPLTDHS
jgi:hypothetical protein